MPETAETVDPANLTSAVEMPKPNEGAIQATIDDANAAKAAGEPSAPTPAGTARVDAAGEPFDPTKHKPYFSEKGARKGRWVRLPARERGEAPPAASKPVPPSIIGGQPAPGAPAPATADRFAAAAEMYCKTGYALAGMAFGAVEEWVPDSDAEHRALCDAVANYLRTTNSTDLPPGAMLAVVAGTYCLPRLAKPKTRAKLVAGWEWLRAKKNPPLSAATTNTTPPPSNGTGTIALAPSNGTGTIALASTPPPNTELP